MNTVNLDAIQIENERLLQENQKLRQEYAELKNENDFLVNEIKHCRKLISTQIAVTSAIKKDLRRYEVQLNSLKTENAAFKHKFSRIENNVLGRFALKIYRWLREIKRRRG